MSAKTVNTNAKKNWTCTIGEVEPDCLPRGGSDGPMRDAVEAAFFELTGHEAEFTFSGWGDPLPEAYRAVVEDREPVVSGVELIEIARKRQIEEHGYSPELDDEHTDWQLARAASAYINNNASTWPWHRTAPRLPVDPDAWERVHALAKAGALIAAEIDRLTRKLT